MNSRIIKVMALSCGLFVGFGNCVAMSSPGWEIASGMLTILSTACGAAVGAPVVVTVGGLSAGAIGVSRGLYGLVYEDLQEGKQHMRDMGHKNHWSKSVKIEANRIYKETCPMLHRSTSPDVFPEVYY